MGDDQKLRIKVVQKLARKRVVGARKKQVDSVKNWFATDEQGRVENLIREMIRDPDTPLEGYGGSRDNVRLTSLEAAKRYIEDRGGELPLGATWRVDDPSITEAAMDERRGRFVRSPGQ